MPFITIKIDQDMVERINDIASGIGVEPTLIIDKSFSNGINFMFSVLKSAGIVSGEEIPFPPYPPIPTNSLNNNKQKETILSLIPLVAGKKESRKKPKVSMPKKWIEDRDRETIDDQVLIDYAEKQGYDWYMAKEMFINFVDYHLAKGNKWADWYRTWYKWVRNDTKFNGPPKSGKQMESVLKSYFDNKNPIEDMIYGNE